MLSYQHSYHAGNFADVVKHVTLTRIQNYMLQKDKPMLYLDTHAGRGLYDLKSQHALKTGEAALGIELLYSRRRELPAEFLPYIRCIEGLNPNNELRYYPGSPWLALQTLRQTDRFCFSELHPNEYDELQQMPHHGKRVFYHDGNGLLQLNALLPPIERRGLVFIDPSYEVKTD